MPELTVTDLERSLLFYRAAGWVVRFGRVDPPFAYLDLGEAQLMLEEEHNSAWNVAPLEYPFGRGMNLQIEVSDCGAIASSLARAGFQLLRPMSDNWYQTEAGIEEGQREVLAADPDGYLLRYSQPLGSRALG